MLIFFFFSSRRRHTRFDCDWSSDVCSSDLRGGLENLVLFGDKKIEDKEDKPDPSPIGIDLSGAQFLRLRNFQVWDFQVDRKSTRLNSSHSQISYAVFCLKKKINEKHY